MKSCEVGRDCHLVISKAGTSVPFRVQPSEHGVEHVTGI
jgi:hypothetical protein